MKEKILAALDDLVVNFVAYDRKEDEDLPLGAIEQALADGEITVGEMIMRFAVSLRQELGGSQDGSEE